MDFSNFIAPLDAETFLERYFDREPLHLAAGGGETGRSALASTAAFLEWLELVPQWQSGRLKMIMDSRPVGTEHYCVTREGAEGPVFRPDRALVEAMMTLGASAVADGVEDISSSIRQCCAMLGRQFGAKSGANLYVSQAGVQAFASHCDPHEVFAIQCEGTKTWRIYANRADTPVTATLLSDQSAIDRTKGPVMMEITMRPGDLLYIPRGFYHDAVASGGHSMHLTFAVQPLYGLSAIELMRELALESRVVRRYMPPADNPAALASHLEELASEFSAILRSRALLEDIAVKQRIIASPIASSSGANDRLLVRTGVPCQVFQPLDGSYFLVGRERVEAGLLTDVANWVFSQTAFTPGQCLARFCHHPEAEVRELLDALLRLNALQEHAVER